MWDIWSRLPERQASPRRRWRSSTTRSRQSINYAGPNPYIDFDKEHLKVVETVTEWPRYSGKAIAGVSGFGFGGANAHLVLREVLPSDLVEPEPAETVVEVTAEPNRQTQFVGGVRMDEYGEFVYEDEDDDDDALDQPAASVDEEPELPGLTDEALRLLEVAREELAAEQAENPTAKLVPLAVSGFLTSRKKAAAAELADWIDSPEGRASSLESIGRSLSRRNHGRSRAVVLAHDHDEAIKGLRALAEGKPNPIVLSADGPVTNGPVWVLAGFGAQHRKMAKSLYLRDETFAEWINKVDALVQDELGYSVVELILDDAQDYGIETTQVTIFAIQVALGELLKAHGAKPGALIGQSLGEAAAAYFAGGLSLADATRTICSRSHLMGEGEAMLFGEYIRLMALVEYSAEEIETVFKETEASRTSRCACTPRRPRRSSVARRIRWTRSSRAPSQRVSSPASSRPRAPAIPPRWIRCWGSSPPNCRESTHIRCRSRITRRCTRATSSVPGRTRSTTWTTGKRVCGTASTSPTASATPSTTATPPSWSWRPIRSRSCRWG